MVSRVRVYMWNEPIGSVSKYGLSLERSALVGSEA